MLESFLWPCKPSACKFFKKRLQHKCSPVKFAKRLRIPLEVLYKKAVLKNFAILTGRKKPVIIVLWKSCSWWLIELWKWRVFVAALMSCSFLKNHLRHSFLVLNFFWLRTILRELRILNCLCSEISIVLSKV